MHNICCYKQADKNTRQCFFFLQSSHWVMVYHSQLIEYH